MAVAQIKYPAAVFGYSAGAPDGLSGVIDYCVAANTITAGHLCQIATTTAGQVAAIAATNGSTAIVVGVAAAQNGKSSYVVGDVVPVVIEGRAIAKTATTVTTADRLSFSATTVGQVASITGGVTVATVADLGKVIAVAEETVTTNASTDVHVRIVKF
jgi:hypothetical protein